MKLEEAIEIETIHNDHNPDFTDAEREEAHQLLIEAGKRIIKVRPHSFELRMYLLPGETKE
ncbi:unnamed protein product [marine sediment metagenome]|uniref:Uncharacterized protein n=1 Tax=marine sediment metagenome TaxID=412755 RepID=X1T9Y3_9ZZZZ